MFSCNEATRLASAALERPLSLRERMQLFMHSLMCAACRFARRRMLLLHAAGRRLRQTAAAAPAAPRLSPESRARLKRLLEDGPA
jgi:hypothetical protein